MIQKLFIFEHPSKGICKLKSLRDFEVIHTNNKDVNKEVKYQQLKRNSYPEKPLGPLIKIVEEATLFDEKMKRLYPEILLAKKMVIFLEELEFQFSTNLYKDIKLKKYKKYFEPFIQTKILTRKMDNKIKLELQEKLKFKKEGGITFTHVGVSELIKRGKVHRIVTTSTSIKLEEVGVPKDKVVYWYGNDFQQSKFFSFLIL